MPKQPTLKPYNEAEVEEIRDLLKRLDTVAAVARERGEPRTTMLKRFKLSGLVSYTQPVTMLVPIVDASEEQNHANV